MTSMSQKPPMAPWFTEEKKSKCITDTEVY